MSRVGVPREVSWDRRFITQAPQAPTGVFTTTQNPLSLMLPLQTVFEGCQGTPGPLNVSKTCLKGVLTTRAGDTNTRHRGILFFYINAFDITVSLLEATTQPHDLEDNFTGHSLTYQWMRSHLSMSVHNGHPQFNGEAMLLGLGMDKA